MKALDFESSTEKILDSAIFAISEWGLQVVGAVALLIVGRWAAKFFSKSLRRQMEKVNFDPQLIPFFSSALYYLLLAVVVVSVLQLFGLQTTSLVAMLGAASLAVGLALQGTLSSFAAGVMLLIFRPFHIGDSVEVGGISGSVDEINLFSTTLHTGDRVCIIVPNSKIYGSVIKNYTQSATRRIDMTIGISYDDEIGRAISIIEEVMNRDDRILKDPEPLIAVGELADSSVNLLVRPWCQNADYWPIRRALTRAFKEALESGGCSLPYPQQDLHVISLPHSDPKA